MRPRPLVLRHWPVIAFSSLIAFSIVLIGTVFFVRSREIMQQMIREQLMNMAAVAAASIDGDEIARIRGPLDMELQGYKKIVGYLEQLTNMHGIEYAYVLRRTDYPNLLEFVVDTETLQTSAELDDNGNGIVDPMEESGYPGELYDISEIPALQDAAFARPTVDEDVTFDQWGATVSGYAPVRDSVGNVVATVGLDMRADDFYQISQRVFTPTVLFLIFAGALLIAGLAAVSAEERQLLVLKKINNERSGLLRLTFHQIGEPLTIMKWSLETLREESEHPHLKKLVEDHLVVMDEGLGRLNSIIDTLQLAEKVDLNTLEYVAVPTSLKAIIDNSVNEWKSSVQKRRQHLNVDMAEQDITLHLDRTLISLVLRQLLMNAIEYSDDGAEISLRVWREHHDVRITVEDHGCGIPRADLERLFEKYRRASNAHLKKPDGNGLGLYIAKGIVEKAGGRIWVESIEGTGTKVSFTLPMA